MDPIVRQHQLQEINELDNQMDKYLQFQTKCNKNCAGLGQWLWRNVGNYYNSTHHKLRTKSVDQIKEQ